MTKIRAVIFDADGVLVVPQMMFSKQYETQHGLAPGVLQTFFKGDFEQAILGKADLKDLVRKHQALWRWDGTPDQLLQLWFAAENNIDHGLVELIRAKRQAGLPVYLATNQERYRARYLREVMFPGVFEQVFVSSEIGYTKESPEYWAEVLRNMQSIRPEEIIFFDDSQVSIDGARKAGIQAHLYKNIDQVRAILDGSVA